MASWASSECFSLSGFSRGGGELLGVAAVNIASLFIGNDEQLIMWPATSQNRFASISVSNLLYAGQVKAHY